eukprot:symbB.v1.2.026226.t1/scaffold2604.1/size115680/7
MDRKITRRCGSLGSTLRDDRERELSIEEGRSSLRAGKSDGFNATALPSGEPSRAAKMRTAPWKASDAPQSFRMLFAVTQQGLVRISGHWAAGGREILPEQKAGLEGHGLYHLSSAQLPAVGSCM